MDRVTLTATVVLSLIAVTASSAPDVTRSPAGSARAQQAYLAYCAMCHGPQGAGDGEVAAALRRSSILVPRLDDAARLERVSRAGVLRIILAGGAHVGRSNVMPEWGGLVGQGLANNLADYVMSIPGRGPELPGATIQRYLQSPPGTPGEGRKLYVYRCSACHGPSGRGDGPSGEVLRRKRGVRPRDLTNARHFAGKTDRDLFAILSLGGAHMGKSVYMPAWSNDLTPAQIKDLVAYLRQLSGTRPRP
jgi:mono/diheme cytochrome c family protein